MVLVIDLPFQLFTLQKTTFGARYAQITGRPQVAYQVILEPGIGRFLEFESCRVQYSYKFVGTFCCAQNDSRKARERKLATLDEKSTNSGIA